MKNMDNFEKVEAYVDGKLNTEDKLKFESDLKTDEELKNEYDAYLAANKVLDELAYDQLNQKASTLRKKRNNKPLFPIKRLLAIAAGILVLLCIGTYWYASQHFSDKALLTHYSEFPNIELLRGESDVENSYDLAVNAYNNNDLNSAIQFLESIPVTTSIYPKVQYFLASLYLKSEQTEKAIATFNSLLQKQDARYMDNVEWYLILAYLQKGDLDKMNIELEKLLSKRDHSYYNKAVSLKRDLNRIWRKLF